MDAITAFLNGYLIEHFFMKQPLGYVQGAAGELVCCLKMAVYGLKQASQQWYAKIDKHFTHALALIRNSADS